MDILIYSLVALSLLVAYVLYRVANPCNTCKAPITSEYESPSQTVAKHFRPKEFTPAPANRPVFTPPPAQPATYEVYTPTHTETTLATVATAAVVADLATPTHSFWSNPSYDFEPEPSKPSSSSSSSFGYDDSHYSSSSSCSSSCSCGD